MDQFDVEKLKEGAENVLEGAGTVLKGGKQAFNGINDFFNFNNPGTKLKAFVNTLNKINLILTLIALVAWFFIGLFSEIAFYVFWAYLLGFIGIAVYYVLSYLSCLFLFGFAEVVENSTTLVELKKSEKNQ